MKIKVITFVVILFFSQIIYAKKIIYNDELTALVNNDIVLNSELSKHLSSLTLLLNVKKTKHFKKQVVKDLINTKLQVNIAKKNGIDAYDDEVKNIYMQFILRHKLSLLEYNDLIKSNNLTGNELNVFIKENIIVEKLHEKLLSNNIAASRDELNTFLDFSNNILIKHQVLSYKILKITINRKTNNKKNFLIIKKILAVLKNNTYDLLYFMNDKSLDFEIDVVTLNPLDALNKEIKNIFTNNLDKNIIGPIYKKKKIEFFKILDKINTINQADIKTKIRYFFLEKNIVKLKENNINYVKNKMCHLNKMKKLMKKIGHNDQYFHIQWLHSSDLPKNLHAPIKKLNDTEVSKILETKNGWYIVQKIYKEYDKKADISRKLTTLIKSQKFGKIRKNWIKNLQKEAYIKQC